MNPKKTMLDTDGQTGRAKFIESFRRVRGSKTERLQWFTINLLHTKICYMFFLSLKQKFLEKCHNNEQ